MLTLNIKHEKCWSWSKKILVREKVVYITGICKSKTNVSVVVIITEKVTVSNSFFNIAALLSLAFFSLM